MAYEQKSGNPYVDRFAALWNDIHNPQNGYFSPEGVPYHAVETLMCEAPDHGHETTSEAYSYWLWLEAAYGHVTGDWRYLVRAWTNMERYIIPTPADQPTNMLRTPIASRRRTRRKATLPAAYPSQLNNTVPAGRDPLAPELAATYGRGAPVYGMHWLIDVDNWYGFGQRGDGTHATVVHEHVPARAAGVGVGDVPQPCWDDFKSGGKYGYLDLFVKSGTPVRQWKYTNAPDADARAIQALYWAKTWADKARWQRGGQRDGQARRADGRLAALRAVRQVLQDHGLHEPALHARHRLRRRPLPDLLVLRVGRVDLEVGRRGRCASARATTHGGYQNPLAAYVLAQLADFKPRSPNAARDWQQSLDRQLEFYRWLQSAEGGIAGGATNSWNGRYEPPPAGTPTFYGMAYDEAPVYHDPPSNEWFGFQAWSMERVAEYYYVTGDARAKAVLEKWVAWVKQHTRLTARGWLRDPVDAGVER